MESIALVLFSLTTNLSGMGVMFGWQPMPDAGNSNGVEKVEYIVQIEPELAATLQEGHSIPITSDIPEDIGPIGRIRIVVGREELPRQKLVTQFKPLPADQARQTAQKKSRDGLIETQFTVPPVQSSGSGRYANHAANVQTASNNQILPPTGNNAASNPFGQALKKGADQARNLANDVKQQILPPSPSQEQLFGSNGAGNSVQSAIDNGADRLQRGLNQGWKRGVEQVADRAEQNVRQAVGNAGQRASDAVDEFGRKLTGQRSILNNGQSSSTILPPSGNSAANLTNKGQRIDQPIQPRGQQQRTQQQRTQQPRMQTPSANFANSPTTGSNPTSQPGVFNAPWPSVTRNPPTTTAGNNQPEGRYGNQAGGNQPLAQPGSQAPTWPAQPRGNDAFDLANRPSGNPAQPYNGNSQAGYTPTVGNLEGPQFPNAATQQQNAQPNWPTNSPAPEIRRDMLQQSGQGDIQTVGTVPTGNAPQGAVPRGNGQGYQQQMSARPPYDASMQNGQLQNAPLQNAQPGDLGWNPNVNSLTNDGSQSNSGTTLFPLLLSWVLLSGSGAGNLYLFWSYLDVRSKYQGVVHGSPLRRDRYDD